MLFQKGFFQKRNLLLLIIMLFFLVATNYMPAFAQKNTEVYENLSYEVVTGLTKSKSDKLIIQTLDESIAFMEELTGGWNEEREEQCVAVVQHLLKTTELVPDITKYQTFDEYNEFGEFYGWRDFKFWMIYTNYLLKKSGEQAFDSYFAGKTDKDEDSFKAAFGYTYKDFQTGVTKYFENLKQKPLPDNFNTWFRY